MKKISILLYGLALWALSGSCIHEYPQEVAVKEVTLEIELYPDLEFIPLPVITKADESIVPAGYFPRVIVEARRAGETAPEVRAVMALSADELMNPKLTLPVPLNLKSVPYQLTVWVDYTRAESLPDAHYNTENLRSICYTSPYEEDYTRREAFFGNASIDLSGQEGRSTVQVDIHRPLAHYRVVATDVQEFLNKQHANGRPGAGEYDVTVSYQYFLVTHLNAVTGEPVLSGPGFGYTRRINMTGDMDECELGADYVLADDKGSLVTVTVEVKDTGGALLGRNTNLEIPYRRGHITTIEGAFLSTGSGSSSGGIDIGVDGDYEGEINIETN